MANTHAKYKVIQGKFPKVAELVKWGENEFMAFFSLKAFLLDDEGVERVPILAIKALEEKLFNSPPSFELELLYRINKFTSDTVFEPKAFRQRLSSLTLLISNYLRKCPSVVTPRMKAAIEANPALSKMLEPYKMETSSIGVPMVRENTVQGVKDIKDPQIRMLESMNLTADLFETLIRSITPEDIKKMNVKDKFGAIKQMYDVIKGQMSGPKSPSAITQVNIYKADVKDLEESILNYAKNND